jgi:hypothetical protein
MRVIRDLKQAAAEIATLAQHAPEQAEELRHAMSSALGIAPAVLHELGKANIRSATAPDQAQQNLNKGEGQQGE